MKTINFPVKLTKMLSKQEFEISSFIPLNLVNMQIGMVMVIESDQFNCLKNLVLKHPKWINCIDPYTGKTPLTAAVISGRLNMVQLLVSNGANIFQIDGNGSTPLTNANQFPDIKQYLDSCIIIAQ